MDRFIKKIIEKIIEKRWKKIWIKYIVNEIASIENGSEKLHLLKNQLLPLLINGQLS